MKLLITGGCGFLGSNIAAHALNKDDQVFVIDGLFRKGSTKNKIWLENQARNNQLTIDCFDIADFERVNHFFEQYGPFEAIAHLAGQVAMTTSMADPRRDFLTNVVGTFNILEATRIYSPDAVFVYSSTNKVYGEMKHIRLEETDTRYIAADFPEGFDQSFPLDFSSPYGCSKGAADQYVRDWHRNFGLNTIVFRHSSIYGGRQFSTFDQGWVGWFCSQALLQKQALSQGETIAPFTIAGNGKQVRDVLHAVDLISLYQAAFTHGKKVAGYIFNIGGGMTNSLSLLELFSFLENLLGIELQYEYLSPRHSDQKVFIADITLAQSKLSWHPQISYENGIHQQILWVSESLNS